MTAITARCESSTDPLPNSAVIPIQRLFEYNKGFNLLLLGVHCGIQAIELPESSGSGYRGSGVVVIFLAWGFSMIPYRLPNLKYEGYAVYTNNPVRAPQWGHAAPQVRFAIEAQLDMIAEELRCLASASDKSRLCKLPRTL